MIDDDDSATGDDDDSAAVPTVCTADFGLNCTEFSNDSYNNTSVGSTTEVDSYSCNPTLDESGSEYTYELTAGFTGDVTVTLTGMTADLDLFVLEDDGSGDCDPDTCIDSSVAASAADETVTVSVVEGTTYYFVVDGFNGATSDYDLTFDCPECDDAWTLSCDSNSDSWNNDDFGSTDLINEYSCDPSLDESGSEYIYVFEAPLAGEYTITLTGLTADLDLFILNEVDPDSCDPNECVAYSDNSGTSDESVSITAGAPGDVGYFVVDGFEGAASDYTIEVSCPDGLCGDTSDAVDTLDCVFDTISGDNSAGDSVIDEWTGCTTADNTGPEVFYAFTPNVTGDYTVELTGLSADIDLFVVEADEATGACDVEACLDDSRAGGSSDEEIFIALESGVTYFLVVDGYNGNSSSFDLSITCPECADNYALNCISSYDDWTTDFGSNDWQDYGASGNCASFTESGPEYVYIFNSAVSGDVTIDLDIDDPSDDLDLFVLEAATDGGCDPDQCLESSTSTGDEQVVITGVVPGETYYIVVDGFSGDSGDYIITMSCP